MSANNCSSGCTSGPHASYGECLRAKSIHVGYCQSVKGLDLTAQKRWDAELDSYRSAVKQGMQPESTRTKDIRAAESWSNRFGQAYSADAASEKKLNTLKELAD